MKTFGLKEIIMLLMIWSAFAGCSATGSAVNTNGSFAGYDALRADIDPLIGDLMLNCKELDRIAKDVRSVAEGYFYGPDDQLNYIQKSQIHIGKAKQTACHQWDVLAMIDYINPDQRQVYYTYRVRNLKAALFENMYDLMSLNTYLPYIENENAVVDIQSAAEIIRENNNIFEKITRLLEPLSNPSSPAQKI
ncbi:MAG: hypothetical protein HKM93_04500 [Desulfobacteraceae bacterium]|nr:hypothetical protein [Desulfobacteraceae bacterium]